jgi:hypothetical protein
MMDFLQQYLDRANEIIGDRTKEEERYDKEVLRWLKKGKGIEKAIKKANQKYPAEAINVNVGNMADISAHYDYLLEHEKIIRKISH